MRLLVSQLHKFRERKKFRGRIEISFQDELSQMEIPRDGDSRDKLTYPTEKLGRKLFPRRVIDYNRSWNHAFLRLLISEANQRERERERESTVGGRAQETVHLGISSPSPECIYTGVSRFIGAQRGGS
jgi:hypothetical protein